MAGIYIHIPYCRQKCSYCNFYFKVTQLDKENLILAIKQELVDRKNYLNDQEISSIYFGGGTPSILSISELSEIVSAIHKEYKIGKDLEVTLEANPDDLDSQRLKGYVELGINRLSIGIQSFHEDELILMNRAHNAYEAESCVKLSQDEGFDNLSIDLIYGVPSQSPEAWIRNIDKAINLNIQHISAYALTVEPKTALYHQVNANKVIMPEEDKVSENFLTLREKIGNHGFEQYEVSNFALEGFYSKHNSSYWQGIPYIGIGPSAHSFDGNSRQWNVANNKKYINAIRSNYPYFEVEQIDWPTGFNEYIMMGLRTKWGINKEKIRDSFNINLEKDFNSWINKYQMYFTANSDNFILNADGLLIADRVASDLMIIQ